ncbi:hypothetical protein JXA32_01780 [Candidatus Sumerlaeota bacterium]|nr:hypothetical protein [Candidatus Sumerlaeota bacterium]
MKRRVRTEVYGKWEDAGQPNWDIESTIRICIEVNSSLKKDGQNPAPKFRKAIEADDGVYIKQWVLGCSFEWINPRKNK